MVISILVNLRNSFRTVFGVCDAKHILEENKLE